MAASPVAFVFPAFISDYKDDPADQFPDFMELFRRMLKEAGSHTDPGLSGFNRLTNPMTGEELRNQYLTFSYGCAAGELLISRGVRPDFLVGYSMGIYAALYVTGSVSFTEGLDLIRMAFEAGKTIACGSNFGMGTVIGLEEEDLQNIIARFHTALQVVNQNSPCSFVVSGEQAALRAFLGLVKSEGALHIRELNVSMPFHTRVMETAGNRFGEWVMKCAFRTPVVPLVSVLDQTLLENAGQIREELIRNLFNPFSWLKTQEYLMHRGIRAITELGPSQGLRRNANFIPGSPPFPVWTSLL